MSRAVARRSRPARGGGAGGGRGLRRRRPSWARKRRRPRRARRRRRRAPRGVRALLRVVPHRGAEDPRRRARGARDARSRRTSAPHAELWERVVLKVRAGVMPPAGMPRPDRATLDGLAGWLESQLDLAAAAQPEPRAHRAAAPAQSHRVPQRRPRSPRARPRRVAAAAARRFELRLRQHRRRAEAVADADGALSLGGAEGEPPGRRLGRAGGQHRLLPRRRRPVAGPPRGRPAARHARRHCA